MKRKNKSQAQSEAKRKWDVQKEVSNNWPPFPLKADCVYPGSKDPERIWCALKALNWLIDTAFRQKQLEHGAKGLYHSELYREQYVEALEEATDINVTWTGWGIKLPTVPVAYNTNRLKEGDFFDLRQWFQIVSDLVGADIKKREKQDISIVEKDIQESVPQQKAGQGKMDDIAIDDKELTILTELAGGSDKTFMQIEIEAATSIPRGTIKDKLPRLEKIGLIQRPLGKRKGYQITDIGRVVAHRNE